MQPFLSWIASFKKKSLFCEVKSINVLLNSGAILMKHNMKSATSLLFWNSYWGPSSSHLTLLDGPAPRRELWSPVQEVPRGQHPAKPNRKVYPGQAQGRLLPLAQSIPLLQSLLETLRMQHIFICSANITFFAST